MNLQSINPLALPLWIKAAACAAAVVIFLIVVNIWENKIDQRGYDRAQNEYNKKALVASEASRERERQLVQQVQDAQNEHRKVETALLAAATAAQSDRDRMRDDLAISRSRLSTAASDAVRKYAATLTDVFGECSAQLEEMAGIAAKHAADSLMLQQAWPK